MRDSRWSVWYGGLLLALVLSVGLAVPASATYADDPIGPSGWVPDGPVQAVAVSGGRVFVGGAFSGGVAALDADTGALLWTGNVAGGAVRALALSSDGSHLIVGGAFTSAGGATHRRLASLQVADGAVEPGWRASVAKGMVRDIVVRGDVAYFGGNFEGHNGLDQRGLGAVHVNTGEPVADFDAAVGRDVAEPNSADVYGLATDGARLFVAGRFTSVDGQPRNQLASVTLATHSLDAWAPARACTGCNLVWDVLVDGGTVYTAGRNPSAVAAYDRTTGVRRWRVSANGDAQALALADGVLYAGGHFIEIAEPRQPRTILAALDPATGAIDPDFRPRFVGVWPGIWALAATSNRLYAGGHFTSAGASPPRRYPYFAMFGPAAPSTAPVAHAAANPSAAAVGDQITFSAAGSSDPDTPANGLTYVWDFGNGGTTADATGVTVTHAYQSGGLYTATVTVTDPEGASDSATADVVVNTAPVARAVANPSSAGAGEAITFSAAGSSDPDTPADGLTYVWDFDNGGTTADDTGVTVTHAYQQDGEHDATVTVTDPVGASDSATVRVVVSTEPVGDTTAPEARVRFRPRPAFTRADITLDGAGSSDDTTHSDDLTYAWRLKRGTHTATGERVSVQFKKPGIHRVRLTVTDEAGNSDTLTRKVRVRPFVHCRAARVDLAGGWRIRSDDRAVAGKYCDSNGRQRGPDVVSFTFQGPEVTVIHGVANQGGSARVFIDGERRRALSFRSTESGIEFLQKRTYRQLGQGEHIIRIKMKHKTGFLEGFMLGG